MKIIIEQSITSTIKTGVGQHTIMLTNLIKSLNGNCEIISNKFIEKIQNATIKRIFYLIWLNTFFLCKLIDAPKDTVIVYTSFLPFIKLKKLKQIGIIHDVCIDVFPEKLSLLSRINQKFLNFIIIKNADKILTVSNTVNSEIQKYYNVSKNKIYTVYNSFSLDKNTEVDEATILKKYNIKNNNKYIISSSSLNPNKNINTLINAFELLNKKYPELQLVLTGGKKEVLKQYLNKFNNPNVIFTGHVDNKDLTALYKKAFCYIFPSIYEGFGIPIIDAQAFGIPVICSDIPIFHEIGEKAVIYSPLTVEGFANTITNLLQNNYNTNALIERGYENCKRFSTESITKQLEKLLQGD